MPVFRPMTVGQTRVLIVEDEVSLRKLLVQSATSWGFQVDSAWSGEDAVRLNDAEPFDVVILDYHLPRIDGIETLRRLRKRTPNIGAIMLTGFGSIDVAKQAMHLDVVEFLTKPCNQGQLEQALDRALRRKLVTPIVVAEPATPGPPSSTTATLEEVERAHILAVLSENDGNRSVTARKLGVTRRTLLNKLKRYEEEGHCGS